jgi:amidase
MTDHVLSDHFSVGSSSLAAVSGYASVTVPAGFVFGLPVGVSFIGGPFSERKLIEIAYAFEQASRARRAPPDAP